MAKLLVVSEHATRYQPLLESAGLPALQAHYFEHADDALSACTDAEVLFGAPDRLAQLLPHCQQLRWVQSSWAGIKPLLDSERRDYLLTGVKDLFGPAMSEFVLGWLLALERNILNRHGARAWNDKRDGSLQGKRIGIMGTGSIGAYVAQQCRNFGLATRGLNSNGRDVAGFDQCLPMQQRLAFAEQLDYLVTLLPDTANTDHLVNTELLAALRPGAILINGGRANCIDLPALVAALGSGQLRHAVLDVLPLEPLPASDPLWQVDNLSITSHTAAPTPVSAIVEVFCENYRRYIDGAPLHHLIDFERGY